MTASVGLFFFTNIKPKSTIVHPTQPNWMDKFIEQEFSRYEQEGISKETLEFTWKQLSQNPDFKRYQVIDSKVYGPETKIKRLLAILIQTYPVPDLDFIYYHQDVLHEHLFDRKLSKQCVPILTPAKHKSTDRGILFIDQHYDISDLRFGWNALIEQINANQHQWSWDRKIEKLFWRGSSADGHYTWEKWTSFPRGRLVYESMFRNPELIDAAFINNPFGNGLENPLALSAFISPIDQLQYKYHLDIDGVSCTGTALQWKLLSGSLVMKQNSEDLRWFHREMIPWKHFIPVYSDLRNTVEQIQWAKTHDQEACQIAENGRDFALTHLMPEHTLLYCYKTLVKYASLQTFRPTLRKQENTHYQK